MNERLTYYPETKLNNPAIALDEHGYKHLICVKCRDYIGSEFDMDYYKFIRTKYCQRCRQAVTAQQKAEHMRRARRNKKLLNQQNDRLSAENSRLRELVAELDSRISEQESRIAELQKSRKTEKRQPFGIGSLFSKK